MEFQLHSHSAIDDTWGLLPTHERGRAGFTPFELRHHRITDEVGLIFYLQLEQATVDILHGIFLDPWANSSYR